MKPKKKVQTKVAARYYNNPLVSPPPSWQEVLKIGKPQKNTNNTKTSAVYANLVSKNYVNTIALVTPR
jgi:hypothetical protein